jgi:hypothetical protein
MFFLFYFLFLWCTVREGVWRGCLSEPIKKQKICNNNLFSRFMGHWEILKDI